MIKHHALLSNEDHRILWEFVRGDADMVAFEPWLYANENLETALGVDLYLDLIACRFSNENETDNLRRRLRPILDRGSSCECFAVRDLDVIDMGGDGFYEQLFEHLTTVKTADDDHRWWLRLDVCNSCKTHWVVAEDAHFLDVWMLQRCTNSETHRSQIPTWPEWSGSYLLMLEAALKVSSEISLRQYVAASAEADLRDGYTKSQVDGLMEYWVNLILAHDPDVTPTELSTHLGVEAEFSVRLLETARKTLKKRE